MIRARWSLVKLVLLGLLVLAAVEVEQPRAADIPKVTAVRIVGKGAATRLEIDLDRKVDFELYTLDDPYRLLVDLPEVDWRAGPSPPLRKGSIVKGLRFGHFAEDHARLVVDLAGPFAVGTTKVTDPTANEPARLSVQISSIKAIAFARNPPPKREPTVAEPTAPPKREGGPPRIVIDPGHGGVDGGTIGVDGTLEKDVVLAVGQRLAKLLEQTGRYEVVLTRDEDVFVGLRQRLQIARAAQGDLFISLHADSLATDDTRGASVYTLSERASDAEAARLAHQENKADIVAGVDLSDHDPVVSSILIDLAMRDSANRSVALADLLVEEIGATTTMVRRNRRSAGFAVLKSIDMPSALIELGFLSNPKDEALLTDKKHQGRIAEAILRALDRYFPESMN